jgi:hypothetical protein
MSELELVLERLERIESVVATIADKQRVQDFYTVEQFAKIVGRSEFTTREWCRHGRINAQKRSSGRGSYSSASTVPLNGCSIVPSAATY